jgi:hypothetical protein
MVIGIAIMKIVMSFMIENLSNSPNFSLAGNEVGISSYLDRVEFLNNCPFYLVPSKERVRFQP